jgi:NRPS condensation-like uncharacterized protein
MEQSISMQGYDEFSRRFFPARLVPFEHYMLMTDTDERPMTTYTQVVLSGQVDLEALRESLSAAVRRHPLLNSLLRKRALSRWEWIPGQEPPYLDIAPEPEPMQLPGGERIDLRREAGLRVWVRHGCEQSRVLVQVHHAAADGRGKFNFLADWLALYSQHCGTGFVAEELPPPHYEALFRRGEIPRGKRRRSRLSKLKKLASRVRRERQPIVTLRGSRNPPEPQQQIDIFTPETLQKPEFQQLKSHLAENNQRLTDWLLVQLFLAMAEWQEEAGTLDDRALFRIMAPYDIRETADKRSPAMNRLSLKFLNRRMDQIRDYDELMQSVSRDMQQVRERTMQFLLLKTMEQLDRVPYLFEWAIPRLGLSANAVLSNLGNLTALCAPPVPVHEGKWRAAELTVEDIQSNPGVPQSIPIAIGVMGYAGRLSLVSRADQRGFTPELNRQFMRQYISRIRRAAGLDTAAESGQKVTAPR